MNKNLQAYPKEEVTALKRMYWRFQFSGILLQHGSSAGAGLRLRDDSNARNYYYKDNPEGLKEALNRHTQFLQHLPERRYV